MNAILCHRESALTEIVLNRPGKRNALRADDVRLLRSLLRDAIQGPAPTRAMLIRGAGPGFCAGRDLAMASPSTEDGGKILRDIFNPLITEVAGLPVPTVAAVQGACVGAGLGLALACDLVIVGESARLGSPFARIGAVLDSGAHRFLLDRLGSARTFELIYTGRMLSGQEAAAAGLVNACVPDGELIGHARQLATEISHGPTTAFVLSKRLIRRLENESVPLRGVLEAEAGAQSEACRTHDYQAGIRAFQKKTGVRFAGR